MARSLNWLPIMTVSPPPDLALFRRRLEAERESLLALQSGARKDGEPVILDQQSVGRLSRMDAMQVQAMARATAGRRAQRLAQIAAALGRIADGSYGECAGCGEEIPQGRLEIDPAVARCVACAAEA